MAAGEVGVNLKYLSLRLFFLLAMIGCGVASASAETILNNMVVNYRALSTYSDKGRVEVELVNVGIVGTKLFTTKYSGSKISFSWVEVNQGLPSSSVQLYPSSDGYTVEISPGNVKYYTSLASALSSIEGVSGGTAFLVPRFLSRDMKLNPMLGAVSVRYSVDSIESEEFYVIELERKNNVVDVMWVSLDQLLLKKFVRKMKTPHGEFVTRVSYDEALTN